MKAAAAPTDRFWSKVLKIPGPGDCGLWTGAVADDGYGRYFLRQNGRDTSVRPHRYAYELVTGTPVRSSFKIWNQKPRSRVHRQPDAANEERQEARDDSPLNKPHRQEKQLPTVIHCDA